MGLQEMQIELAGDKRRFHSHFKPPAAAEPYRPEPALVAAAQKEGQILIYTTLIVEQIVRPMIKVFQSHVPGIDVKYVRADSTALLVRLTNEARANRPQADIWHMVEGVGPLIEAGIAGPLDLPAAKGLPSNYTDPNGRWVTTNLALRSRFDAAAARQGAKVFYPRIEFCTDNAAMIAVAGLARLKAGTQETAAIRARANWSLAELGPLEETSIHGA